MMKEQPNFGVLMEGKFPDVGATDGQGYAPVFSEAIFTMNVRPKNDIPYISGRKTLGVDVAYKGKDSNVWVVDRSYANAYKHQDL
jgi:hypothetical protein